MATITNTVTLDEIINTIKLRTGITDHYRLTSVILSMLQEFNLFYIKEKKSIEINPNGRNFIELPTDFVEYQKIGYLLPTGEIQTLTKNERLVDSIDIVCGDNLSWIEQQGVDNCIDPYTVEAKEIITLPPENGGLFYIADETLDVPDTSSEILLLNKLSSEPTDGDTFTVIIPVGSTRIIISLPEQVGISSIVYEENLNQDITTDFNTSTVLVDEGTTERYYTVFSYLSIPTASIMTFKITI